MKQKFPKVTVVTVTYNAVKFLEETIKSVIEQDYQNIEYIIIDGGSTDGTVDMIKKYESHLAYWISELDKGIYDAMNKGIDVATGEWINFMNAGDTFVKEDTISKLIENIDFDIELIYGATNQVSETNQLIYYQKPEPISQIMKKMPFGHQSLLLKMNIMKQYRYNIHYTLGADRDLITKLFINNHKYKMVNFPVSNYLQNVDGASRKHFIKGHLEVLNIVSSHSKNVDDIYLNASYKRLQDNQPDRVDKLFSISKEINKIYAFATKISKENFNIVIYGYGHFAKMILHIFANNNILIIDKNSATLNSLYVKDLDSIKSFDYDLVLITVLGRENEIKQSLISKYQIPVIKIASFEDVF